MSRKPLYVALLSALLLSVVNGLLARSFLHDHQYSRFHPEWLHDLVSLLSLPGGFVAMIRYGMCNTDTLGGWTICILVNALIYAIPFVILAGFYRRRHREQPEPPPLLTPNQ